MLNHTSQLQLKLFLDFYIHRSTSLLPTDSALISLNKPSELAFYTMSAQPNRQNTASQDAARAQHNFFLRVRQCLVNPSTFAQNHAALDQELVSQTFFFYTNISLLMMVLGKSRRGSQCRRHCWHLVHRQGH